MLRITTACRGYSGRQLFYNNSIIIQDNHQVVMRSTICICRLV